jgi:hypothetical protein
MPMRKLVIAVVGIELLALSACGYTLASDAELTDGLHWAREFKAEHPEAAEAIAWECKDELVANANFSRDGAVELFDCMRREAKAQGHA